MTEPLVCRACGSHHPGTERFCPACGLPLVHTPGERREVTERQARARKVKVQYSEGSLVPVAWARNQAEAELISGLLLEEGVPSVVRRSGGFDVPDFLAAGPRDILVAQSGADIARDVLRHEPPDGEPTAARAGTPVWVQALAVTMVAVVAASTVAWLLLALLR